MGLAPQVAQTSGYFVWSVARLCFRHPENHLARTHRCEGIRSPLVADSVGTVTEVNTLEL